MGDRFQVVRLAKEVADRSRHYRPDVRYTHQQFLASLEQIIEFAEMPRQIAGRRLADVANAQSIDKAGQGRRLARCDGGQQIGSRFVGHPLQAGQGLQAKNAHLVEIGR